MANEPRYASSLHKGVALIEVFRTKPWLGASELAIKMGVDRSTSYRLAQALTRMGWLRYDSHSKKYHLGIHLWELGALAIADMDVRQAAIPAMQELVSATGESSDLGILDASSLIYIERVEGSKPVRVHVRIGQRVPAHAIAMGKVLLAHLPAAERARRLPDELPRFTCQTLSSLPALDQACERILRDGYAVNLGEHNLEAGGIAAPVHDRDGECIAAISIDVPTSRLTVDLVDDLVPLLLQATARASANLGWRSPAMIANI
ncbi:MAG: IclR family transcriptional regulator [Chloroflexota bacterium]